MQAHSRVGGFGLSSQAMTKLRNSISPWLAAISSVLILGACASGTANAPAPKSASDDSAAGSEKSEAKASDSTKQDMSEDETDEVAKADKKDDKKGASDDAKEKGGKGPVDDSRTTETLHEIIKKNRAKFKKCYEDERAKAQDLKGSVVLELTLDGDGKLKSVGTNADESTIKVKAVTDCIVKVAQSITWPPSSKGLNKDFRYEFGFNNK